MWGLECDGVDEGQPVGLKEVDDAVTMKAKEDELSTACCTDQREICTLGRTRLL